MNQLNQKINTLLLLEGSCLAATPLCPFNLRPADLLPPLVLLLPNQKRGQKLHCSTGKEGKELRW